MKNELRGIKEFNGFSPSDAIDYLSWYLVSTESDDERCSDAIKRIKTLIEELSE